MLLQPHDGQGAEVPLDEPLRLTEARTLRPVLCVEPCGQHVGVGVHVVPEDVERLAGGAGVDRRLHPARCRENGPEGLLLQRARVVAATHP